MISLADVSKLFGSGPGAVRALDNVSMEVGEGEFAVVLGPSGSGKTTLLNIVGALDVATTGRVRVAGVDITAASQRDLFAIRRQTVSFVFQGFNLFPGLTAEENVQFAIDATGRKDLRPAREVLADVGLGEHGRRFPHELSGGEQQRVAIARALGTGNPIMLADEPTGELDYHTGVKILALLREQVGSGRSVLVVTHNREISRSADRVIEMSSGTIVSDGPPEGGPVPVSELYW